MRAVAQQQLAIADGDQAAPVTVTSNEASVSTLARIIHEAEK
jgi:hypothetical protein